MTASLKELAMAAKEAYAGMALNSTPNPAALEAISEFDCECTPSAVLALIEERDALRGLLQEAFEMAENWPGIAYTYDLTERIEAALSKVPA